MNDLITPTTLSYDRVLNAFFDAFGVQRGLINGEFKAKVRDLLENGDGLKRSTLRRVIEGEYPGAPKPVDTFRQANRLQKVLLLADVCETLMSTTIAEEETDVNRQTGRTLEGSLPDLPGDDTRDADAAGNSDSKPVRKGRKPGRPAKRDRN